MPGMGEQIEKKAVEILKSKRNAEGMRYTELVDAIRKEFPDFSIPTISGAVSALTETHPDEIYKPDRGRYRHVSFSEDEVVKPIKSGSSERSYYEQFAEYLTNELEECSKAIPLGGKIFKDKWGTPDVIGIKKSRPFDIIQQETTIVTAEIKSDSTGLIAAFGQSCAYKLFSHKVYIVIPKNSSEEDKSRIEALCLIFGIGLILFDSTRSDNPQFEIRVRPFKHEPDSFYVNKYMELLKNSELFS